MLSKLKEPVSGFTHLAGALLSLAGTLALVVPAFRQGETVKAVSFLIFGLSLILLYSASATYHLLRLDEKGNRVLRRIDHMMIYLLIAGTHTPICLVALPGAWGWGLLSVIGALAAAGIILTLFVLNKPRWVTVTIYITMGWLALAAFVPLVRALPLGGVVWIVLGGVFYTVGAVVYARKKPDPFPGVFGFHEVWHLFVMAGSLCHYLAMFTAVQFL